jgi:hypothetical protein
VNASTKEINDFVKIASGGASEVSIARVFKLLGIAQSVVA